MYIYSYIAIFFLAVANIFIALVESAYMISLQTHYKQRGAGKSKTMWSEWGSHFAIYARRVLSLGNTGTFANHPETTTQATNASQRPAEPAADATARRLAALEATLAHQTELMRQLLAAAQPRGVGTPRPLPVGTR